MDPIARPWQVVMFGVLAIAFWSWVGLWGWIHTACPRPPARIEARQPVLAVPSREIEPPARAPHEALIREAIKAATPVIQARLTPDDRSARVEVRVEVTAEGRVSRITALSATGALSGVNQRAIQTGLEQTPFPAFHEAYVTEFPLIFLGP